jgi:COMMD2-7/10, HN domain
MSEDSNSAVASSASLFTETKRFKEAIDIINDVAVKRVPVLLGRIIDALHDDRKSTVFTTEEEEQLREMFSLTQGDLTTMVDACSYIFEQAAYHSVEPQGLQQNLVSVGVAPKHGLAFASVWSEKSESYLSRLSSNTLGAPLVLDSSSWRLQMTVAQEDVAKSKDVRAIFNMHLKDANGNREVGIWRWGGCMYGRVIKGDR